VFSAPAGGIAHRLCAPPGPSRPLTRGDAATLVRLYTARLPAFASEPPSLEALRAVRAVHDLFVPWVLEREPAGLRGLPRR
jgi:hypothetical protein